MFAIMCRKMHITKIQAALRGSVIFTEDQITSETKRQSVILSSLQGPVKICYEPVVEFIINKIKILFEKLILHNSSVKPCIESQSSKSAKISDWSVNNAPSRYESIF